MITFKRSCLIAVTLLILGGFYYLLGPNPPRPTRAVMLKNTIHNAYARWLCNKNSPKISYSNLNLHDVYSDNNLLLRDIGVKTVETVGQGEECTTEFEVWGTLFYISDDQVKKDVFNNRQWNSHLTKLTFKYYDNSFNQEILLNKLKTYMENNIEVKQINTSRAHVYVDSSKYKGGLSITNIQLGSSNPSLGNSFIMDIYKYKPLQWALSRVASPENGYIYIYEYTNAQSANNWELIKSTPEKFL